MNLIHLTITSFLIAIVSSEYIQPHIGVFRVGSECKCPLNTSTANCDITGQCECQQGYHGRKCSQTCACENQNLHICDPYDGDCRCIFDFATNPICHSKCECNPETTKSCFMKKCICEEGFYDPRCNKNCNCSIMNSLKFSCSDKGSCDCLPGYYGKRCDLECNCSSNAHLPSCTAQRVCHCKEGWTGQTCDKACNCDTIGTMRGKCNHMGYCYCRQGFTGKKCDQGCGCTLNQSRDNACDPFGFCKCLPNFYGPKCQYSCECRNVRIDADCSHFGYCPCLPSYYGKNCQHKCNCMNSDSTFCDFRGNCLCRPGFYGRNCNRNCSCNNQTSTGHCDTNGFCECLTGFYGKTCSNVQQECGKSYMADWYNTKRARIVNGITAQHPVPWIVHIILRNIHVCSGAILNRFWVITLSSCFIRTEEVSQVIIKAGDYALDNYDITEFLYTVDYMVISPYDPYNDVRLALLRIKTNEGKGFHWNSAIQPICLNPDIDNYANYTIFLAGWGFMNNYERASIIQTAILSFTEYSQCTINQYVAEDKQLFCSQNSSRIVFTCIEEPGNPLSVIVDDTHYLVGLFFTGSKDCNVPGFAVFANIYHYHDWIFRNIMY